MFKELRSFKDDPVINMFNEFFDSGMSLAEAQKYHTQVIL